MVNLTTLNSPTEWAIGEYLVVGLGLMLVMLVAGYGIGVAWQRLKDGRKRS